MLIKAALVGIVVLVGLLLAGFGVGLIWMALRTVWEFLRMSFLAWRSRGWSETTGTITRSVVVRIAGGRYPSFAPGLAYAYEVAGQGFTGTRLAFNPGAHLGATGTLDQARDRVKQHPRGTRVPVFFDPHQPGSATLDRSRPDFGLSLFFFVLPLLAGAAFTPLGVYMMLGAVTDPPKFADGELPTLAQQLGGLLVGVGGILLLAAALRLLRARRQRPLLARLAGVAPTRAADVRKDQDVAVFGRAEAGGAGTATSPVTGEPVVYHRAVVRAAAIEPWSDVSHCDFYVRDESGRILVVTEGGTDQLRTTMLPVDGAARTWLDTAFGASGFPVPQDFTLERGQIVPGGPVLVVGRAERDRASGTMVLAADADDPTSLVFAEVPLPELTGRIGRGARRGRQLAAAAALMVLVGVLLMVW